ncbi:MAG: tRNA lysidine(34) synthetase TilS, partial [Bacteroidia bacterium]|nr:tRNA lysidine(34) synthetase TilS [Bacteroidia bacterium]
GSRILIAVSGGVDSVVLTQLCHLLKLDIALAHCNFNLRGEESDSDESFVYELAKEMDLEVFIESFDTEIYAKSYKVSIQMAARDLRYSWFEELAEQLGFEYILTAHHADDELETFLINLSRGTGLDGLAGIPEINGKVVRPLLPFSRDEIIAFAKSNKLKWREDSSNRSEKYLRNKLRLEVIPKLKDANPKFLKNFKQTQKFLKDSRIIINDKIDDISNHVITQVLEKQVHFNIQQIKELTYPKAYLYELFKDYGFTEWNDIEDLLNAQPGKYVISKTHRLLKDREKLILSELSEDYQKPDLIHENTKEIDTAAGRLILKEPETFTTDKINSIHIDKELLKFPLELRKWQDGDYFYPFGMKGKKKLSKFFKDEKLSLLAKENTWLLCSGNDIIWVVNRRLDDRFKVTQKTKSILKITVKE